MIASLLALACMLLLVWLIQRWRVRRAWEHAFNLWLDQVAGILRQFGKHLEQRTPAQWRADFAAGVTPIVAAGAMLKRLKSEFKVHDPKTSNCVSTTWNISSH
jgi:hypothetical protein